MSALEKIQDKSSHGGARKNAGRPAGAAARKTREIADKAAEEGITPLEVMLKTMRALMDRAEAISKEIPVPGEKQVVSPLEMMVEASSIAKDAAPYMHAKLSSVEMNAKVTTRTLDEELAALNAANGNADSHS